MTSLSHVPIEDLMREIESRIPGDVTHIINTVCKAFDISPQQILARGKGHAASQPRSLAVSLVAQKYTMPETARFFGRECHTIVIASKKRVDKWLSYDKEFKEKAMKAIKLANKKP